jgi:hypothetical protein
LWFVLILWRSVLLVIHPIIQSSAILIALYVFYLGEERFRSLHLHQKRVFRWKRFLNLIHGLNNLIVLILALTQMMSGWWVYRTFVTGG